MKHTPGPWKVCDDGINVYAEPDIAITNQDHPCAPDQEEAEANAHLISAAPKMETAIRSMLVNINLALKMGISDAYLSLAIEAGEAALKEATGKEGEK